MNHKFKKNRKKGFSFVEVMLVVFILSTTLMVLIQIVTKSIDHSSESRDTIIATNLAQEGTELVKNVRDNNWTLIPELSLGAFDRINSNLNCKINYNYSDLAPCLGFLSNRLYLDAAGFYVHSFGFLSTPSEFYRRVTITPNGETRTVTSYVTWDDAPFPNPLTPAGCTASKKCVYATIILTKWGGE